MVKFWEFWLNSESYGYILRVLTEQQFKNGLASGEETVGDEEAADQDHNFTATKISFLHCTF